ncbi:hypothetical protein [Spirulina sp. 06S082]|uniref:hypothetical protein n=1 Tax=Spirulina sp. 06S082 TaxID=3110248 RepID=UPI002B1FA3C8|nr:hypothetical protein [Spirulina sp. 06S082]MEA5468074.1 hypothetical protein [Spirulina sp. 06S082]
MCGVTLVIGLPLFILLEVGALPVSIGNILSFLIIAGPFFVPIFSYCVKNSPKDYTPKKKPKGPPIYNLRFDMDLYFKHGYQESDGIWYLTLRGQLTAYFTSGMDRGKVYRGNEITSVGTGYSESTALADAQYKFNLEVERAKKNMMNL